MTTKNKKKELEFEYKDDLGVIFTDVVRVHMNLETVTLELALKDPTEESAKVTHKVVMTVPHFLRFVDVAKQTSDNLVKHMKQLKKEQK